MVTIIAQATSSPSPLPQGSPQAPAVTPAPSPPASPSPPSAALALSASAINLHPGQSQRLAVLNASGAIAARVDPALVNVAVDMSARTLTVSASQQTGRASVSVTDATGASVNVPVRVALDAATVPASLALRVTGQVDPTWLQSRVQSLLAQSVQLRPGAGQLQFGAFAAPEALSPGGVAAIAVPVRVAGGDQYFDVNTVANVNVSALDVAAFSPPLLFYDDDPERITAEGVLFRNQVSAGNAARLYYYHQNMNVPRQLFVVLRATTGAATIQLIDASAGPNIDVMTVGHAVSRNFLVQKPRNEGVVLDVMPGTPAIAERFAMQPLDGAAGSIGIHVLNGGPVQVEVVALPADAPPSALGTFLDQPTLPGDGHQRRGVFDLRRYGAEALAYTTGGPDAMTQYGATSPPTADPTGGHDYGDYGVIRTLTFDLANPTAQPATVYLYEQPMGGVVRSSFLVNGILYELGCARVSQRYQIGPPVGVSAGSTARLVVQTMTDGGSNYPLEVGVTSAAPLPSTPPISAPDGCFPKPGTP